ncbi:flavodoxin domain-containing protein [uncultured Tateyamaria sp.]|uniref:flavodoxin domain-containing protein n=1 Tax=uncultured Tateyamaria sp. TaxID=455651 RepID=UPI00260854A7|nr:flavodoxin domain-containing protein [uncultured Tateyamaria sp.]
MTILIAFGTVEGQTRKIAQFVDEQLRKAGQETVLFDTDERTEGLEFDGVDKVILAASVHERRHPKPFEIFVASSRQDLAKRPTLLLSISLKAAFPDGREEAQDYVDEMKLRTGLTTTRELLVAGAIRSDSYDFYASQVLHHVVLSDQTFDPSARDYEFTDWDELGSCVADFLLNDAAGLHDETAT